MIYGRRVDRLWPFCGELSRYDLQRGEWLKHANQAQDDLLRVLPRYWPNFYPAYIRPEFRGWFRHH
jgi:hypothetical protein